MEALNERIKRFLTIGFDYHYDLGSGYGVGYGDLDGYGFGIGFSSGGGYSDGYGDGCGYGDLDGYGCDTGFVDLDGYGYGYGDGNGYGYGYGLKNFNGFPVHLIDRVETVLCAVHGDHAKGFVVNKDLTTKKCFVVKGQDKFAHGETLAEALKALQDKIFEDMDTDEKIDAFLKEFKPDVKYPAKTFYEWHHKLTGSCEFGRNAFVKNHDIDLENGTYTVNEFIDYTKNDFGGEIIQQLEERMKE